MSLMGIDIGQSGAKGCIFSEDGQLLDYGIEEYKMLYKKEGFIEIDIIEIQNKLKSLIKRLNYNTKSNPVRAVSVSTFGESVIPVDKNGKVLSNVICPNDIRGKIELDFIINKLGEGHIYRITSLSPSYTFSLSKILWHKSNNSKIYNKTHKFLFMEDMFYNLLGIKDTRVSYSICGRTMFFNINEKRWQTEFLNELDIDYEKFSEPVESGRIIGFIPETIKEELGFDNRVSIVIGGHDQSIAALGVAVTKEGLTANSMGTVECITPVLKNTVINDCMKNNKFCCGPHVVKDHFVTFAYNMTSGSIIDWYKDTIGFADYRQLKKLDKNSYNYIFNGLEHKPSRLQVLPYFGPSATPYFFDKPTGSIIGLTTNTTAKEIFQSIVESLVFEMKLNIELLEKCGIKINQLRTIGGSSRSDYWLQLKANILNKPIFRMKVREAGCLGAAILAGIANSVFKDNQDAADVFVKTDREFLPNSKKTSLYDEKYNKYKKLYQGIIDII